MVKRVLKALITCFAVGLLLTGCGSQIPEMTEDEYNQTVQYMVSLLMKHSNNGVEKLSSLSSLELQRQLERDDRNAKKAARDKQLEIAIANMPDNNGDGDGTEETDNTGEDTQVQDTTDTTDVAQAEPDNTDENNTDQTDFTEFVDDTTEKTEIKDDIENLLDQYEDDLNEGIQNAGLDFPETDEKQDNSDTPTESIPPAMVTDEGGSPATEADKVVDGMRQELSKGMFLTYSGYSVAATYPDNDDIFVINATAGKKLLILNFRLANTSGMDVTVDMVKANPHFQIILNGVNVGYTNVTMLDNDLSSFAGTITSGQKKSMVLIKQMDAAKLKNVETLGLIGDLGGETIEFNLE
ncbi:MULTISPECIES: hypothetical protein [unclassified Butyrivibrio]|uniref:hypothetical protein n=1 Tax=unclassified Butyrivibrio TaxID=2639466 RepID=UPI00040E7802|nr:MULTISPECIES: hypothetical protein [unclassified Butyrivibrio]